jgi:hypothetical protein
VCRLHARCRRPAAGSRLARANFNMSVIVERSAPEPANVGISQSMTETPHSDCESVTGRPFCVRQDGHEAAIRITFPDVPFTHV